MGKLAWSFSQEYLKKMFDMRWIAKSLLARVFQKKKVENLIVHLPS